MDHPVTSLTTMEFIRNGREADASEMEDNQDYEVTGTRVRRMNDGRVLVTYTVDLGR